MTGDGATPTRVGVAVPAAGLGRRMGGVRKPWLELAGEPVLRHTLRPFLADERVVAISVALSPEDAADPPAWLLDLDPRVGTVEGGDSRAASVARAVATLPADVDVILVHDAARPLVDRGTIDRCVGAAVSGVGAVAGVRAVDTLKEVEGGEAGPTIVGTPDRTRLWHAQTPQAFPADLLRRAVARTDLFDTATDDASLVEAIGGTVVMVEGHPHNLKVTRPEDLPVAAFHLERLRGGAGAATDGVDRTDLRGFAVADLDADELAERLADAVEAARAGRPLVYPTETVYGVGSGLSAAGVDAVRAAKRRADDKPLLALVDGIDAVPELEWTDEARALAETFWPGALTLVLRDPRRSFPAGVRSGEAVAVRHTPHPVAAALVRALGGPLTSSSANRPGEPPATDSASALAFAEGLLADAGTSDAAGRPHLVDVGTLPPAAPSTLVDCTVSPPRVLREGSVPVGRLRCVLPGVA